MSRLTDLAAQLPQSPAPGTSGRGYRMWEARRANNFLRDVKTLTDAVGRQGSNRDAWRFAADAASEYLAARLPADTTSLPRGYSVVENSLGQRAIARQGVVLNPGYSEPPDDAAIEVFAQDLKTGWLGEVERFSKVKL
jgi:hypothetical protein